MARTNKTKKEEAPSIVEAVEGTFREGPPALAEPYRVLSARHSEPYTLPGKSRVLRKVYTTGDIVWSARPLHKLFVNKFERLRKEEAKAEEASKDYIPEKDAKKKRKVVDRGGGRFDVMDLVSGQPLNEEYLSLEDAKYWEETGGLRDAVTVK